MDLAPTKNGVNGDVSVLMANVYNGLTWGDRLLELHTSRTLAITFTQQNAVQPGGTRVIWFRPIRPGWELATSASVL